MSNPVYVSRCVLCNTSFTKEQLVGAMCCPSCKSKGVPMSPDMDVTVKINVHELRILGIWAENYAVQCDNKKLDDAYYEPMKVTVGKICERVEAQLREQKKHMPLTLSGEFAEVKKAYPKSEFYRDGKEEV